VVAGEGRRGRGSRRVYLMPAREGMAARLSSATAAAHLSPATAGAWGSLELARTGTTSDRRTQKARVAAGGKAAAGG
jgi:hypothetical protein